MHMVEYDWLLESLIFKKLDLYIAWGHQERLAWFCSRFLFSMHTPVGGLHPGQSVFQIQHSEPDVIYRSTFASARRWFLPLLQKNQNARENQRYIRREVIAELCAQRH